MRTPDQKTGQKVGRVFLVFAGICIVALPFIVYSVFSSDSKEVEATLVEPQSLDFDHEGSTVFVNLELISKEYLQGISSERTLSEYYSLRQYIGSPPFIPHAVKEADLAAVECLACHARGGWTEELKRHTPITPHPDQVACRQCHVRPTEVGVFVENNWMSISPPRLGRSELPGSPTPIPHDLQMRGNCIACHVGPAAVTAIRVEHPSRGNCRQCHVPDSGAKPFKRRSES
jgi:cytochrome c-type protein NapB